MAVYDTVRILMFTDSINKSINQSINVIAIRCILIVNYVFNILKDFISRLNSRRQLPRASRSSCVVWLSTLQGGKVRDQSNGHVRQ